MVKSEKPEVEYVTVQTCAQCRRVHDLQLEAAFRSAAESTENPFGVRFVLLLELVLFG